MIQLSSSDWHNITGRGWVAAMHEFPDDMKHPGEMLEQTVEIDGKQYYITGVETFAVGLGPRGVYPRGLGFGLIVRGEK